MFDEITKSVVLSGTECDCHEVSEADRIMSLSFEQTFSKECLDRSAILRAAKVVIVPRCVRRLGAGCFELSEALECVSFQLGSQLESIGERCFYKCALLKRVEGWLSEYVRNALLVNGIGEVLFVGSRLSPVPPLRESVNVRSLIHF